MYNKVNKSETDEIVIYITPRLRKHLRTGGGGGDCKSQRNLKPNAGKRHS